MIEVTFMSMNNEIEFKQILDQDTYSKSMNSISKINHLLSKLISISTQRILN